MAVMAEDWRQVGAVVNQVSVPAALVSDGEYRSTFPFAGLSGYPIRYFEWESWRFSCATAAQKDTRWNGHRDGYCLARNNFRVYHDVDSGRFVFFPHGMDVLFGNPRAAIEPRNRC